GSGLATPNSEWPAPLAECCPGAGGDIRRVVYPAELGAGQPVRRLVAGLAWGGARCPGGDLVAAGLAGLPATATAAAVRPGTPVPAGQLAGTGRIARSVVAAAGRPRSGPSRAGG